MHLDLLLIFLLQYRATLVVKNNLGKIEKLLLLSCLNLQRIYIIGHIEQVRFALPDDL